MSTLEPVSAVSEVAERDASSSTDVEMRRRAGLVLIPMCLFVAAYCLLAGNASGGWHPNRDGDPSYSRPVQYSYEFYIGLRWSATLVGVMLAGLAFCWRRRAVAWPALIVAIVFNPLVPLHLPKSAWECIDLIAFWVFFAGPWFLLPPREG